jgi:peptidoglycan DL-endopeptidase CwlO
MVFRVWGMMRGLRFMLGTRLAIRVRGKRRVAAVGATVVMAAGLATAVAQVAGAQPQPSISDVQAKVNTLSGEFDKATAQYDQVAQQLTAATARLKQVNKELARDKARFEASRKLVVQIAASSYEDSSSTSLAGLLTAADPGKVLTQASILLQLKGTRNLQAKAFLAEATQLVSVQQEQERTETGIRQLAAKRSHTKDHIAKLLSDQKNILSTLTAQQVQQVQQGTVTSGGGNTHAHYTGPTSTQAEKAVAFVFAQLGCPYSYGSVGPCSVGFDCSGLVMSAWAAAGISIPRDTYSQYAALPHVSLNDLQPGDLVYYNGIGHVAMYVGGGMIIDAPTEGQPVRELSMNTAWYSSTVDGAARP